MNEYFNEYTICAPLPLINTELDSLHQHLALNSELRRILARMYEIASFQGLGLSTDTLQSTNRAELTAIIRRLEALADEERV
jgi:hypothetical protein